MVGLLLPRKTLGVATQPSLLHKCNEAPFADVGLLRISSPVQMNGSRAIQMPSQSRFSLEPFSTGTEALHRVRAAWISDVHLGTRTSNAEALLQFLRDYDCEKLYVVGDLIDIWQLRHGRYWPQQHNDVIQKILRKARKGVPVIYIPGNHDEFVSTFGGAYGNISTSNTPFTRPLMVAAFW